MCLGIPRHFATNGARRLVYPPISPKSAICKRWRNVCIEGPYTPITFTTITNKKINFRITSQRAYGKYSVRFYALGENPTFNTEWKLGAKTKYLIRKRTIGAMRSSPYHQSGLEMLLPLLNAIRYYVLKNKHNVQRRQEIRSEKTST